MPQPSFFHLLFQCPPSPDDALLDGLTPEEFELYHAEAAPLFNVLMETLDAYAKEHDLSMMGAWIAADIVRYCIACDIREDEADA